MQADNTKYLLGASQEIARTPGYQTNNMTPDNKLSEGIDSVGAFNPAPFLPIVRHSDRMNSDVVISSQKPVAHCTTSEGYAYIVPAGLAIDLETRKTDGNSTNCVLEYTVDDVRAGIKNAKGEAVTKGEKVVESFFDGGTQKVFVSNFCGMANYDILRHPGGDGLNPALTRYRNFNPQPFVSYNMDYAYEYPMVKDLTTYESAPMVGLAAFVGKKAMAGQFITYDAHSNFVVTEEDGFTYGTVDPTRVIGQVSRVVAFKNPETGKETGISYEQLNRVKNYQDGSALNSGSGVNNVAGSNTNGMPEKVFYTNAYGVIHFAIQTR